MKKINILHITPHLGGGVGKVLLNYLSKVKDNHSFAHKVACLDYANESALDTAKNVGLKLSGKMAGEKQQLLKMVAEADIVIIHHWNHPLLYDFLVRTQLPPCRLVIWSHISGFHSPYVFTEKILQYPDILVFTTPISFETKEVRSLSDEQKKSLRVVWSTGGAEHVKSVKPKEHPGFNIGYIGTVSYAKMHSDFLNICGKVNIPDVKFIVCGGPSEKEIKKNAEKLGIADKFSFTGPVSNITEYLSIFDIFGYPLAPYHYGTCDQVLQESMAAGVVPVVLENPMESYMVKDRLTGIVAKDKDEYIKALEELYHNSNLRNLLSKNAREYAVNTFSLEKMADDWDKMLNEALSFPKIVRKWKVNKKIEEMSPKDVFLESLGSYGKAFTSYCDAKKEKEKKIAMGKIKKMAESANWQSETKSTVHQYHSFFPDDKYLSFWSKLMKGVGSSKK